jgi:ubiquinone/menaquinone biosynthesis methyltransferase
MTPVICGRGQYTMKQPGFSATPDKKRMYNRRLFGIVAAHYHFLTRVLSFGRDPTWKRWLVDRLPPDGTPVVIDIASGNGDIAFRLRKKYRSSPIFAADLTPEMFASTRLSRRVSNIAFVIQDMSELGFKNTSADIVTGGYALRNAPDLEPTLAEIARILKPGGIAAFLDFSRPSGKIPAFIEYVLLKSWGGLWGLLLHGNPEIYGYIAESLRVFPDRASLHALLSTYDIPVSQSKTFFFGIIEVLICRAKKPISERINSRG